MRTSSTIQAQKQRLGAWIQQHARDASQAEALPLRRDMVTLLTYARDNPVIGTQSTGNMPLKSIREVTARFVDPPTLDATIGDHKYVLRTEEDIWPLYFLHIMANVGGMLSTARARRWRLTSEGKRFLDADPLLQAPVLLAVWWYRVNWLVAFPVAGLGDALPASLSQVTLACLRGLPVGTHIAFEPFADTLIAKTGLTWTAQDSRFAPMLLRSSIRRMVISILADFNALECRYRQEPLGKGTIRELDSIKVTLWGGALLEATAILR